MEVEKIRVDVIVIGAGLAGLTAATTAGQSGKSVLIVSKGKVGKSGNTIMARNNIAAVFSEDDSFEQHLEDTMLAGCFLNDENLVTILCEQAPEAIYWLWELGVEFSAFEKKLVLKNAPGHSKTRIISIKQSSKYSSRAPGLALTLPVASRMYDQNVKTLETVQIIALRKKNGIVIGAIGLDRNSAKLWILEAPSVILACGGAGQLYPFTSNAGDVTGDGYALAHEIGAELLDMEFIQFHPTVTVDSPHLALSTCLFTEGAVLENSLSERFMDQYSSKGHLATRDVMSRSILLEIIQKRGTSRGGVYLNLKNVDPLLMRDKYNDIYKYFAGKSKVEVAPAAHFTMGGIKIDKNCCTSVPGLFACGEVAGGVHGANRLAGNALIEAVVFGRIAGKMASNFGGEIDPSSESMLERYFSEKGYLQVLTDTNKLKNNEVTNIKNELRQLMGSYVGLLRSHEGLVKADQQFQKLWATLKAIYVSDYRQLLEHYQLKLMLTTAELIVRSAIKRRNSIGAHFRLDTANM